MNANAAEVVRKVLSIRPEAGVATPGLQELLDLGEPAVVVIESIVEELGPIVPGADPPEFVRIGWPRSRTETVLGFSTLLSAYWALTRHRVGHASAFFRRQNARVRTHALRCGGLSFVPGPSRYFVGVSEEYSKFAEECARSTDIEESHQGFVSLAALGLQFDGSEVRSPVEDALLFVRRHPRIVFPSGVPDEITCLQECVAQAVALGATDVAVALKSGWWIVSSDYDWFSRFRSDEDHFRKLIPLADGPVGSPGSRQVLFLGSNATRVEVGLAAFAVASATAVRGGAWETMSGRGAPDSPSPIGRAVAFRFS